MESYNEKIIRWSSEDGGNEYVAINKLLDYLGENLYHDYEPTFGPYPDYYSRLKKWINNLPNEDDQKSLLKIAKRVFYVGRDEFSSLYRTAYNNHIIKWILDQEKINIDDADVVDRINKSLDQCWFCPVTDSLRINQFYHVNQVTVSHEFRPDWRSLRKFGDPQKLKNYIRDNNIKYLVLLEDFVGSATQSWKPLKFASELDKDLRVLFVPLIICKLGIDKIKKEIGNNDNFYMSPVLILSDFGFIAKEALANEELIIASLRKVIEQSEPNYRNKKFGFEEMGCLIVMHTNIPTNSLPILHYESNTPWNSLFKRHHRAK